MKLHQQSPAPWKALGKLLPDGTQDYWIVDANGEEIVAVYLCDGGDEPLPFPADGNAHLIAAAPELLAALKLIEHHFGDPLKVARAAIEKAEGRQP